MSDSDFSVALSGTTASIMDEAAIVEKVQTALARGSRKVNIVSGYVVETDSQVRVATGPVIGEVTATEVIFMLEVTGPEKFAQLGCDLYREDEKSEPVMNESKDARCKRPTVFKFQGLEPDTKYTAVFNGVSKHFATNRMATFRTKKVNPETFRIFALSCDRPSRLLLGQQNPWLHMLKQIDNVDVVLHVGDQIYPDNEDIANADTIFNKIYDQLPEVKQRSMMLRGRELWRNKYRNVFSSEGKVDVLSRASNLMIWSDNDVANDFTTMKNDDGEQKYHPNFLQCGMRTYREYQRRLWDAEAELTLPEETGEWHKHVYGPVGVFMFDLRGNRINGQGHQQSEEPLISESQWSDLESMFSDDDLRVAVLCSETPFLGDTPEDIKAKVEANPEMDFLRDHWPYNDEELVRLLDLCFGWMSEGEGEGVAREVLLIGGDIHCGVTSVVRDEETGLQINHLTTSPVTNHVCKFFPPPQGKLSDRYNFSHLPLGQKFRNYADIQISIDDEDVQIQSKLVPISTDIFKDTTWRVEDSDEE